MKLSACYCDTQLKLSPVGILQLMEDSVTEYMHMLDIDGTVAIRRYGCILVYAAAGVRIFARPAWQEEFTVRTFISAKEKARLLLDTVFESPQGSCMIYGRTEICGIDLETQQIRRINTFGVDDGIPSQPEEQHFDRLHFPAEGYENVHTVTARSTNIDYLHHVNNIEYVRFLEDTYSVEQLEQEPFRELMLYYRHQAYEGETLRIGLQEQPDGTYYEIRRGDDLIVRARIITGEA